MKKVILLVLSCLFIVNQSQAQVSVFLLGVDSQDLDLVGNDLYYTDENNFFKANISDIDLPTISPVGGGTLSSDGGIFAFTIDGSFIYYGTSGLFSDEGNIYRIDTSMSAGSETLSLNLFIPYDMELKSGFLYFTRTPVAEYALRRINVSGAFPVISSEFSSIASASLTVNGNTLYIGANDGKIYKKNLLIAGAPSLYYTGGSGPIKDLKLFETDIYFIDNLGIKKIPESSFSAPTATTVLAETSYGNFESLVAKSYVDGSRYLLVTETTNDRILKVNLNTVLSIESQEVSKALLFPNPTVNNFNIKTSDAIKHISIYDMLGKSVLNLKPSKLLKTINIDTAAFLKGIYVVNVRTATDTFSKRIVIK